MTSLRQRMQHVPGPLLDVGLALMVAVAILIAIGVAPQPGRRPDALANLLGLTIAGLVLVRRRWPVAVLVASVAAWFGGAPLLFRTLTDREPLRQVLNDTVPDVVPLAAVLVLGEAIRNRGSSILSGRSRSDCSSTSCRVRSQPGSSRPRVIADGFPDVTVLLADIVDFTSHSERIPPEQVVEALNDLFSAFDQLALQRGLEKIKTIGDAYMVVGGLPDPRPDHAEAVAEMALAMREEVVGRSDPSGQPPRRTSPRERLTSGSTVEGHLHQRRLAQRFPALLPRKDPLGQRRPRRSSAPRCDRRPGTGNWRGRQRP